MRWLSPSSPVFSFLNVCSLFKGFNVTFPSSIALAFSVLDILDCPVWGRRGFSFLECLPAYMFYVNSVYTLIFMLQPFTTWVMWEIRLSALYFTHCTAGLLSTISLTWVPVFVCVILSTPNSASASPFSSVLQLSFSVLGILSSLSLMRNYTKGSRRH